MATETLKFKYVQSCLVSGDLSKVRHFPAPPTRPCPDLPATPSSVSSVCSSPSPSSSFAASSSSSTPSPFSFSSSSPFSVAAFSSSHSPPSSRERNKQNGPEMPPHSGNSNRSSTSPKLQKFQAYSHTGQPGVIYTLEAEWDEVSGKYAIDLRDIEYTFQSDINGHILIKNGEVVVKFLNDKANKRRRLKPLRIAYHDNVLLQVVPVGGQHLDPAVNSSSSSSSSPAGTPRTTRTIETQTSQATLFRMSVVSQTRQSRTLLKGISEKVNLISSDIRANHIEVMDLLNENTDRILAQSDNLFRLTRGLHESPIPSHFVVLPCPISFKDRLNPFVVKYRLYFLCDCDVSPHAATSGQRLPHVHFAKHEGYDMVRPTEFFRKYGPYVLTMLKLLWVSVELGSAAIPNVPGVNEPLQRVIDAAINGGKNLLQSQIKFAIDYLERLPEDERLDQTGNDLSVKKYNYHLDKIKALEGADLRHLVSFLKNRDPDQTLGNLYRLARPDGTVHWVCLEHYHPNYKAEEQKTFTEFVRRNKGFFDSNKGKVEIRIGSRDMATKFYELLVNAKFVQELVIVMAWKTSLTDFLALQETITPLTTIMSLTVDCCHTQSSLKNMVCSMIDGTPATILAEIMAGPSRQVFVIKNHNSFLSQVWRFPSNINLQTIDLGSCIKGENLKENLKTLVKKTPFLKHLILKVHSIHTVPILFADPKSYRFKSDVAVLEVHLETGEIITGSIQAGKFIEVTLTAMDCSKNFTMLPFVTKMITKIAANTSLRQLSRFVRKNTALKDVEIEVAANMFFQIHQLLAEASRGIRSAVFHDELDNTLRMSDIRDSSTADVVLRDDSVDFERLLGAFKAVPRRCGFIFAVNDLMAELFERRTKAGSPITSLKIDLSALSVDGLSKLFIVIQRSQLQELHLTHTGGANSNSTDTPDLTSDSLLLAFLQKTVPFLKGTHLQLPCRADQIYSYGVTIIKLFTAKSGCQLTLSDGTNSVLLDDVHDTKKAKVSVSTDNIGVSLNEFFVLFGSIPSTIGVSIEVTDSIVEFLDDVSASPTMVDIPLRSISVNPMTLSEYSQCLMLTIISRCSKLLDLNLHYNENCRDFIAKAVSKIERTNLRLECEAVAQFLPVYQFLLETRFGNVSSTPTSSLLPSPPSSSLSSALSSQSPSRPRLCLSVAGTRTIYFDNIRTPLFRMFSDVDDLLEVRPWEVFDVLPSDVGFSRRITDSVASSLNRWIQATPSTSHYKNLRMNINTLSYEGLNNMANVISSSTLSSLTIYCSSDTSRAKERRDRFLKLILPYMSHTEVRVHCRLNEFQAMAEFLHQNEPLIRSKGPWYILDGDRSLVTHGRQSGVPVRVDLQGKRGVYYFDPQGKLVDEWDDLGEVLVSLGTNLVKLDTESFVFLDEHAVQLNQTMAQESRLASLRLAPSHLSKTGLDAMQAIIDRSHVLTSFTFVCGSDHAHMASNEALEMLVRNRKRITELVLQGSEIRFWLQQLSHRFHKRAFLPALSALKIISDGDTLGGELQEWIANLVRDVEGFRSLTSVHLRNANLSPRGWEMFFRELTSASLEELDLSNSDVSQSLITEWIQELGSEAASRFRRLNLQGTFITPSDLMIVIAALESRSVNARLDGAPTVAHEQQDFGTLSVSSRGNDDAFANTDHAIDSTNNPKTGFATTPLPSTSVDPKRRQRQYSLKKGLSLIIQHPAVNGLPRPYVPPPPRSPQFSSQDLHPPTSVHMPPAVVVPLARSSSLLGSPLSHIRKLGRRGLQRRSGGGAGGFGDSDHADIDDDDDCKKDESDGTENGSSTRSPERCQSPRSPQMLYPTALVMQNELMPSSMRTISLTGTSAMVVAATLRAYSPHDRYPCLLMAPAVWVPPTPFIHAIPLTSLISVPSNSTVPLM